MYTSTCQDVDGFGSLHTIQSGYKPLRMGNRAKELRELRGLSVQKAAELIGTKRDTLYKLERGQRTMTEDWQRRLAKVYAVPTRDIVSDGGLSIEIKHTCFRALNVRVINVEHAPKKSPTSAQRYIEAPGFVMRPSECFGFRVADDHASHLFPSGASGVARPIDKVKRPLRRGEWVIVRHFKRTGGPAIFSKRLWASSTLP